MKNKKNIIFTILFFIVWGVIPFFLKSQYLIHIVFLTVIYSILSSSLNLAVGITGLSSMSHASFFSVGAYAAAITATRFGFPFYITLLLGGVLSMMSGVALGAPTLRLKGFYLALVTIGFGQLVRIVQLNWISLTKGPMGIPGIPSAQIGNNVFSKNSYIIYGLIILIVTLLMIKNLKESKTGRAFFAICSDEIVAKSLGVNTSYYKVLAFALSAFFAGMAGSIYAHYVTFVSPDTFTVEDSNTILCMVILGGSTNMLGPVLSAILLTIIPEILRFAELWRTVFVGVVLIGAILYKETGFVERLKVLIRGKKLWQYYK
jgi:branched-chain amino acid transport system permease protein